MSSPLHSLHNSQQSQVSSAHSIESLTGSKQSEGKVLITPGTDMPDGSVVIKQMKDDKNVHVDRLKAFGRGFAGTIVILILAALSVVVFPLGLLVAGILAPTGDSVNKAISKPLMKRGMIQEEIPDGSVGLANALIMGWMGSFGMIGNFIKGEKKAKEGFDIKENDPHKTANEAPGTVKIQQPEKGISALERLEALQQEEAEWEAQQNKRDNENDVDSMISEEESVTDGSSNASEKTNSDVENT